MASLRPATVLVLTVALLTIPVRLHAEETHVQHAALSSAAAWRADMLRQINRVRARHGVGALRIDARLNRAAQSHSDDMARRDFFDHRSPEGVRMTERADRTGYHWRRLIENIAGGYPNIAATIQGWMESPDHRAGLLDNRVRDAGFGYVYLSRDSGRVRKAHYWTLLIGRE
jgi:uncharacterized protein YkwD